MNARILVVLIAADLLLVPIRSARADGLSKLNPAEEYNGSIKTVLEILAPHSTQSQMTLFAGTSPTRCTTVSSDTAICVWPLSKKESGWYPLAKALDTGDRLNLVCELPRDDSPRAKHSCSVHSQRSNRSYYKQMVRQAKPGSLSSRNKIRATLVPQARKHLDFAQKAFQLSTLVGDAPDHCRSEERHYVCLWRASARTYGHGTLAMTIAADLSKKVRMTCRLPADGSPRAPESCSIEIGN